jgi:glycosyltransferase involved in cell wall biosynthesis
LRVAFVLKGYPRLSETFIAQEIAALEKRGLEILIVSLRRPTDGALHAVHREVRAKILYLPEYLLLEPLRVFRSFLKATNRWKAAKVWLKDLARDPTPNRIRRFGQALVLAAEAPRDITWLHAHFLHTPASVTRYAATLLGLPWSGSAHAKDIWTTPEWEKREKLAACEWLVTCTAANQRHLAALAPAGRVELVYHGLDLRRFPPPPRPVSNLRPPETVTVLSVCRLVEKKGMDLLLEALARLPQRLDWRFVHVGGGPLARALKTKAEKLGIAARIAWRGPLTQEQVLQEYRAADIFALASRVARDGDRDGLPNVLAEAQSQGLPCVATRVAAIQELLRDGASAHLVEEGDCAAFAAALESLITQPARRRALGAAGEARVRAEFALETNLDRLAARFGLATADAAVAEDRAHRVLRSA